MSAAAVATPVAAEAAPRSAVYGAGATEEAPRAVVDAPVVTQVDHQHGVEKELVHAPYFSGEVEQQHAPEQAPHMSAGLAAPAPDAPAQPPTPTGTVAPAPPPPVARQGAPAGQPWPFVSFGGAPPRWAPVGSYQAQAPGITTSVARPIMYVSPMTSMPPLPPSPSGSVPVYYSPTPLVLEKPLGKKDMGSYTTTVYTEEQQARLCVDETGLPRLGPPTAAPGAAAAVTSPSGTRFAAPTSAHRPSTPPLTSSVPAIATLPPMHRAATGGALSPATAALSLATVPPASTVHPASSPTGATSASSSVASSSPAGSPAASSHHAAAAAGDASPAHHWTPQEDAALARSWPATPGVLEVPPSPKHAVEVAQHAEQPQELLHEAARREEMASHLLAPTEAAKQEVEPEPAPLVEEALRREEVAPLVREDHDQAASSDSAQPASAPVVRRRFFKARGRRHLACC